MAHREKITEQFAKERAVDRVMSGVFGNTGQGLPWGYDPSDEDRNIVDCKPVTPDEALDLS